MPDPHVIRAMRSAHTRHVVTCVCGKRLAGNGHKSHQRACPEHLAERGWPLDDGFCDALRDDYPGTGADVIQYVQRALGRKMLTRRNQGDKTPLPFKELREAVWAYARQWEIDRRESMKGRLHTAGPTR